MGIRRSTLVGVFDNRIMAEKARANYPNQPGYDSRNPNYAGQPGYGNQSSVPNPNQPGYSNQGPDYPNQPGYGNQPSEQVPGQPSPSYPMPEDQGSYVDPTKAHRQRSRKDPATYENERRERRNERDYRSNR